MPNVLSLTLSLFLCIHSMCRHSRDHSFLFFSSFCVHACTPLLLIKASILAIDTWYPKFQHLASERSLLSRSRLLDNGSLQREKNNKDNIKKRTWRQEMILPGDLSTMASKVDVEPEWLNNEEMRFYVVCISSCITNTWDSCKHAPWRSCVSLNNMTRYYILLFTLR